MPTLFSITFILQMQAEMPHFQQFIHLRFGIWKRWRRAACTHFVVRVLLQCVPIQSIKRLCAPWVLIFPYWTSDHCAQRLLLVMSWLCDDFTTCIVTSLLWRVHFNWNVPCDEFTVWRLHCKPTSHTYCIHTRIIHQARGRQTVQNINEKHASSPSVATANASVVELLKLLILYNETAFPVDYKCENGQQ